MRKETFKRDKEEEHLEERRKEKCIFAISQSPKHEMTLIKILHFTVNLLHKQPVAYVRIMYFGVNFRTIITREILCTVRLAIAFNQDNAQACHFYSYFLGNGR